MNKSTLFFALLIFFGLQSCDDAFYDTNIEPPETTPMDTMMTDVGMSSMTAKVDGEDWSADNAAVLIQVNRIGISGMAANGSLIILSLEDMGEGNYELTQEALSAGAYNPSSDGSENTFVSNASEEVGFVNISELNWQDSTISGTFAFVGARAIPAGEVNIEEGKFENLPVRTELTAVNDFNSLEVKVDEVLFQPEAVFATKDPFQNGISISATAAEGIPSVGLHFPDNIETGTYELGTPGFSDYSAQYNISDSTFLAADSGELIITKHDKSVQIVEGTFHFEAAELIGEAKASLTEGRFSVTY